MSQKIVPNLWFDRNAEEAGAFYAAALPEAESSVEYRYPSEGLPDFQRDFAGEPLTVALTVAGTRLTLINADATFRPNPTISFILNFDPLRFDGDAAAARERLNETWAALGEGGTMLMPLGEYPFSAHYGWIQDRYGVSWQLLLTDPAGEPRPFVVPTLMFCGAAQNRATEAVDFYLSPFDDAALSTRVLYPSATGPATASSVMFSDFSVDGQWIAAMDSGVVQEFTFGPGVSLEVQVADQEELDRIWNALSAVPEAEQCGWLVDQFGVSWQVVPRNLPELMERPNAYEHMLNMKKIVIADF